MKVSCSKIIKFYGPPGTGKTTALASYTYNLVANRNYTFYPAVLCVSFIRSAVWSLKEKFSQVGLRLRSNQFRTLHSLCYDALNHLYKNSLKDRLVTEKDIAGYFIEKGYGFSLSDLDEDYYSDKLGNKIYKFIERVRHTWDGQSNFLLHFRRFYEKEKENFCFDLDYDFVLKEYHEFNQFLQDKFDHTKLLLEVLKYPKCLDIFHGDVLVIDEAQDLTLLEWSVLKELMKNFEIIIVAGDDDQAIYTFTGTDPGLFLGLKGQEYILNTSYRLSSAVCEKAKKLISLNKKRKAKEFKAIKQGGEVIELASFALYECIRRAVEENKTVFLLCRNHVFVKWHAKRLYSLGIPFTYLDKKSVVPSWAKPMKNLITFRQCGKIDYSDFLNLFSTIKDRLKKLVGVKDIGAKVLQDVYDLLLKKKSFPKNEVSKKLYEIFITRDVDDLFYDYTDRTYYSFWKSNVFDLESWLNPKVYIGTIHKAKGLETDKVFIDLRVTREVFLNMYQSEDNLESERRVFYVAMTRARDEVYFFAFKHRYIFTECFYL
ncbi:UvrD-helicase domain-containing protein [Caldisericum sp.]|uniref:UvrD-helicase domain-containing protein n=1 Tax=Caldisericum sp. TaxID=2499687 RepID=UPI003D1106E7